MKKTAISWICILILALSACHLFSNKGNRLSFGAGELYYKDGVGKDKAEELGEYLLREGFFDETAPKSVQVAKKNDTYVFRMVTRPEYLDDAHTLRVMRLFTMDLATDVFGGTPVDIELTDDSFGTQKEIKSAGVKTVQGAAEIYRFNEADAAICDKVTDYLIGIEFISERPLTICYGIEGDDFLYEVVTAKDVEKEKDVVNANKAIAGLISVNVLSNKPIRLNFLDENFAIKSSYPFEEIRASYLQIMMQDSLNY